MLDLKKIIRYFGTQSQLADKLGVHRSAVTYWINDGHIPPQRLIQIEQLSNGKFKATKMLTQQERTNK